MNEDGSTWGGTIDPAKWFQIWARLCRRFNREVNNDEAGDYLAYLAKAGMGTASVTAAAEAVWATREFFPKPADFLTGEATVGWTAILNWTSKYHRDMGGDEARALLAQIPARAKEAINALGGLDIVRQTGSDKLPRLRREYFDAFASVVIEESVAPLVCLVPAGGLSLQAAEQPPGEVVRFTNPLAEPGLQRLRVGVSRGKDVGR